MELTKIAAWWGAVIATLLLGWDIYKWKRSGPIINVSVSSNMKPVGNSLSRIQDKTFIYVEVVNKGDRKTTITHLVVFHYSSFFKKLINKKNMQGIVVSALNKPLPYVLEPGELWQGGILQNKELEEMIKNGYLYCGIFHSSGNKPILRRVVLFTK